MRSITLFCALIGWLLADLDSVGRAGLVELLPARLQQLNHALQPLLVWLIRVAEHVVDGLNNVRQADSLVRRNTHRRYDNPVTA